LITLDSVCYTHRESGKSCCESRRVKNSAEPCFPGAVTGSTEINCPHCGDLLTVTVRSDGRRVVPVLWVQRRVWCRLGRRADQLRL